MEFVLSQTQSVQYARRSILILDLCRSLSYSGAKLQPVFLTILSSSKSVVFQPSNHQQVPNPNHHHEIDPFERLDPLLD
mgnify:CR=1 FL=1